MKRIIVVTLMGLLCLSMFSMLAPSLVRVSASSPPGMVDDFCGYCSTTYELLLWGNPLINGFPDTSVTAFNIYKDGGLLATVDWHTCRYRDYNPVDRWCQYGVSAVNAAGEGPQKTFSEWWSSMSRNYYDLTLYCNPPQAGAISGFMNFRSGQTTAGWVGGPAMVVAHPAPGYNFIGPWTKTGAITISYYGSQPICYIDNWWGTATITGYFQQLPAYDVTISAHCNTEGTDVSVPITMDGAPTGYNTPHVFSSLTGSHTFAVPSTDLYSHPFTQWNTGETTTTITVAGGGTYTAYYQAPPPPTYNVVINAHCNSEGADVNVGITKDGSSTGFNTPHTFTGLTGSHTFAVPSTDPSSHPFASWDRDEKPTTITVYNSGTHTAYYQDGLKGISSTLTISSSLVANTGFTLQQNFYLFTGRKDNQNNPEVYWCQNAIEAGKCGEGTYSRVSMWIWKCYFWETDIRVGDALDYFSASVRVGVPSTIVFESTIRDNYLWMENDVSHGPWKSNLLVLTSSAYITSSYVRGSSNIVAPNFVIVGPGGGGEADFTAGSGSVSCLTETSEGWSTALYLDIVWPKASTGETSKGLMWFKDSQGQPSGGFGYQAGALDQGIFFGFDINGQTTQAPVVNSLGTPVKTITVIAKCPVYIDLYDDQGRCVGYNRISRTIDFQIENVIWNSNQSLFVFDPLGTYRVEVTGTDNGTYELESSWQDITGTTCTIMDSNATITENTLHTYVVGDNPDVALVSILSSKTVIGKGSNLQVNVTVADIGGPSATFDVALYANGTIVGIQNALNLSGWNSTTVCFAWNTTGLAYGNYTISAYAWPVPGETNTTNNNCTGGWILVTKVGDLNIDGIINYKDASLFRQAYIGEYNYLADFNQDGVTNYKDASLFRTYYIAD